MFATRTFGHTVRCFGFRSLALVTVLATVLLVVATSTAAELADSAKSLRFTPANVAFYSASLRLQEQLDLFRQSHTYQRLMQVPIVQLGKMQALFQWQQSQEPGIVKLREYFQSDEGKQTAALLNEMCAQEIFVYGSHEWAAVLQFVAELNSMQRQIQFDALIAKEAPEQVSARLAARFKERFQAMEIPQTMLGFRLQKPELAVAQLDQLHMAIVELVKAHHPELEKNVQREAIAGHSFVTVRLDGSQLPWDEMRSNAGADVDDATFNEWRDVFSRKKLVLAVGVVDDFLLALVGNSMEPLENLGQGELLVDSAALRNVKEHADQRLISIGYASAELTQSVNSPRANLEGLVTLAESGLKAAPLDETRREQVVSDVRALVDDLAKYLPQPGAAAAVSFLTPRGVESFTYRGGSIGPYDSSRAITLLDHAGGSPLFVFATSAKHSLQSYDQSIAALSRVALDMEEIAEKTAPTEQWAEYQKWRPKIFALLTRLNTTTRENLYPALAEGQMAMVLDASAASDKWIAAMPPADKPLPMLEMALVGSVADAARLRTAVADYFQLVQDTIALMHEADPTAVSNITLPQPIATEAGDSTSYRYDLPAEWGVDAQLVPNATLSPGVWALSLFPQFTTRLIESKPLESESPIDVRRPAAIVVQVRLPELIDAVRPWVDYGFKIAAEQDDADLQGAASTMPAGFILPQVHQLLDVLAAIDSYTGVTYLDNDVWVTHAELHFVDKE